MADTDSYISQVIDAATGKTKKKSLIKRAASAAGKLAPSVPIPAAAQAAGSAATMTPSRPKTRLQDM
jgi:hypothetical protein